MRRPAAELQVDALCLLAAGELLLARATGGPMPWQDVLAQVAVWGGLAAWARSGRAPTALWWACCVTIGASIAGAAAVEQGWPGLVALALVLAVATRAGIRRTPSVAALVTLLGATAAGALWTDPPAGPLLTWLLLLLPIAALPRLALLAVPLAVLPLPHRTTGDGPDLLLITVDTLRADERLPSLDRLPAHATIWTPAPWTLPALASLWTSQPAHAHGAGRGPQGYVPLNEPDTLPQALQRAGYRTHALSGGNPFTGRTWGLLEGFTSVVHPWSPTRAPLPRGRSPHARPRPLAARWLRRAVPTDAASLAERAARALDPTGPDFVWLHLMDLHLPIAEAPCRPDVLSAPGARLKLLDDPFWSTAEGLRCWSDARAEALKRIDAALSALLDEVDLDHTLVAITADHGESLGEHGLEHGHSLHPSVMQVPLALGGVGAPATLPDTPLDLLDLGATLRATAGLPIVGRGRDLRGPVTARPVQLGAPLYLHEARGVVWSGWSLRVEDGVRTELALDPGAARPSDLDAHLPPPPRLNAPASVDDVEALRALGYLP
jgi:hypothetical protein